MRFGPFAAAGLHSAPRHTTRNSRKGPAMMATPERQDLGDVGLFFAAHNNHGERCGRPPRLRNTNNPGLYHGYFENRYGEQFIFVFGRTTKTGRVSGGDLGWGDPRSFTLGQLGEVVRDTQRVAAPVVGKGRTETSGLPVIDAALALGRVTGITGQDEVIWLRACLEACSFFAERPDDHRPG